MHTGAVAPETLAPLTALGATLFQADLLPTSTAFNNAHAKREIHGKNPFTKGEKPSFHTPLDNFVKLRLWQLTRYDKIVFIDADALVLRNLDRPLRLPRVLRGPRMSTKASSISAA